MRPWVGEKRGSGSISWEEREKLELLSVFAEGIKTNAHKTESWKKPISIRTSTWGSFLTPFNPPPQKNAPSSTHTHSFRKSSPVSGSSRRSGRRRGCGRRTPRRVWSVCSGSRRSSRRRSNRTCSARFRRSRICWRKKSLLLVQQRQQSIFTHNAQLLQQNRMFEL